MSLYKFNGHEIEVTDDLQQLNILRYQDHKFQLSLDAEIGNDWDAYLAHNAHIKSLINSGLYDEAKTAIDNRTQNLYFILNNISPEHNAFIALIKSIDGRLLTEEDFTKEGKKKLVIELGKKGMTMSKFKEIFNKIKKKMEFDLKTYFPHLSKSLHLEQYFQKIKEKALLMLDNIIEGTNDNNEAIQVIDEFLLRLMKPRIFQGSEGVEVKSTKWFSNTCAIMTQYQVTNEPTKLSVVDFLTKLDLVKAQIKSRNKTS